MIAIRIDTASATSEAHWAFILKPPRRTKRTTSGMTAKIAVSPSECDTGSRTCLYTWMTSLARPARRVPVTPARAGARVRRLPTQGGPQSCNRLQTDLQNFGRVEGAAARAGLDLGAAREAVGHHDGERIGLADGREQDALADRHRNLVALARLVAERSGHSAAAGVRELGIDASAGQEVTLATGADQRVSMAVRMHQRLAVDARRLPPGGVALDELVEHHRLADQSAGVLVMRHELSQLIAEHRGAARLQSHHRHARRNRLREGL